jgi:hypothetical protein
VEDLQGSRQDQRASVARLLEKKNRYLAEHRRSAGGAAGSDGEDRPAQGGADAQTLHDRYKDLTLVEQAFRTSKTVHLEMRPWYVRSEKSTRGHTLVVMLAYLLVRYLRRAWTEMDLRVEEGLRQLTTLCATQILVKGEVRCNQIPTPRDLSQKLLQAADIHLPQALPHLGANVVTRKKLTEQHVRD